MRGMRGTTRVLRPTGLAGSTKLQDWPLIVSAAIHILWSVLYLVVKTETLCTCLITSLSTTQPRNKDLIQIRSQISSKLSHAQTSLTISEEKPTRNPKPLESFLFSITKLSRSLLNFGVQLRSKLLWNKITNSLTWPCRIEYSLFYNIVSLTYLYGVWLQLCPRSCPHSKTW